MLTNDILIRSFCSIKRNVLNLILAPDFGVTGTKGPTSTFPLGQYLPLNPSVLVDLCSTLMSLIFSFSK